MMELQKAKVSVILPTYNRAYCLERSVRSVLSQTYQNLELVIVDDGSTDDTAALIAGMKDERIHYVATKSNQGVAAARNYGLEYVTGDYIAFQDSDDCWRPEKLCLQMQKIEQEQAGFCYHKVQYDFGGGQIAVSPQENVPIEKKSGDIYAQLLYENMVDCPALLVRRECIEEAGGFDTELKALEDYDLALRLGNAFRAAFVDCVLIDKNYTENSVSRQAENYLNASSDILVRYQKDYMSTGNFDHRVLRILEDAQRIGKREYYLKRLMESIGGSNARKFSNI